MIVLDIGANNGDSTRHFADGINEIFVFEPCTEMIEEIHNKAWGLENYHIFTCAVSNFNGTAEFNIAGQGDWGCSSLNTFSDGLDKSWPGRTDFKFTDKMTVRVIRLDSFIEERNIKQIDYLHCDAQGSDLLVLEGLGKYIDIVKEGVIEVALNKELALYKEGDNTLLSAVDFLTKNGFRWMEISPWANESNIHFKRC